MRVLIIEDEKPAARRLANLLRQYDDSIEVLASLDTVKRAVQWFSKHDAPDLTFMDIQLADGLSFAIFEQTTVASPIIFTTAYDQYAIQAFRVNSVDYLLKPISPDALALAIDKFRQFHTIPDPSVSGSVATAMTQIQQAISTLTQQYKTRFVIKVGEHIKTIPAADILYFVSQEKATYAQTQPEPRSPGRRFIVDYSLEQVEALVDPNVFFRISRRYIVSLAAIEDIITYSSSRLRLILRESDDTDVLVSRERVSDFRQWLDQ